MATPKKHPLPNSRNNTDGFPAKVNSAKIRASIDKDSGARQAHERSLARVERLADRSTR